MGNSASNFMTSVKLDLKITPRNQDLFLMQSEMKDMYFKICEKSPKNMKARNGNIPYSSNHITQIELQGVENYIQTVYNRLPKRLLHDLGKVRIVQLMPSSEGGMPHTRPGDKSNCDGIICFPVLSQAYSFTTLNHELWHIHQRKYTQLWEIVFYKQGWLPWNGEIPDELEENRRYNPDTIDCPLWIFQDNWIPIPIFRDISNPKIGETDIWFYNPKKRIRTRNIPGELLSYYSESLPSIAFEHPRELSAYMLSEPDRYKDIKAFKDLIEELGAISLTTN